MPSRRGGLRFRKGQPWEMGAMTEAVFDLVRAGREDAVGPDRVQHGNKLRRGRGVFRLRAARDG